MNSSDIWEPVSLSLQVGAWAVLLLILPSAFFAGVLQKRGALSFSVDALVQVPLVLPPVVTGYGLLWLMGPQTFFGRLYSDLFGTSFAFTFPAAVAAAVVVGLPFMVKSLQMSFDSLDPDLWVVTDGLGIPRWIAVPLFGGLHSLPGLLRGSLLAFSRGFGEFGATVIFASNIPGETRTVPLAIHTFSESFEDSDKALFLSLVAIALALAAVFAVRSLDSGLLGRRGVREDKAIPSN